MNNVCLCIDLRTAAHKLTQVYDEAMAPSGISVTQFSQMHLIQSLDGPTLKELAEASQLERSTLGRNVKVLEKLGLVRLKVGEDARTKTIHLSRKGANAFKRAVPLWYSVQSELVDRLGPGGRAGLDAALDTLTAPLMPSEV
jgi:DNA-binding MarR family transcriptional regulator